MLRSIAIRVRALCPEALFTSACFKLSINLSSTEPSFNSAEGDGQRGHLTVIPYSYLYLSFELCNHPDHSNSLLPCSIEISVI